MRQSLAEVVDKYNDWYKSGGGTVNTTSHKLVLKQTQEFRKKRIETILDIGCGRGFLLKELQIRKFKVTGTEIANWLFRRDLSEFNFYPYGVEDLSKVDEKFDLVLFVDTLDHLRDAKEVHEALKQADRLATKGIISYMNASIEKQTIDKQFNWWADIFALKFKDPQFELFPGGIMRISVWK